MKLALLVNPAARGGAGVRIADQTAAVLREHQVHTTILRGDSAAQSRQLLRAALHAGVDAVAVAGGDGTVALAVDELASTGIPLGVVPCGTGNDFAAAMGIRALDAEHAASAILSGTTRVIDLARVTRSDDTTAEFATVLASGFDSKVNDRANGMRWPRGGSRYSVAILIEFLRLTFTPYDIEAVLADGSVERFGGDLLMATVANGPTYGGGIPIAPHADLGDGLLDLVLVRPVGRVRLLRLLPRVYRGTHTTVPEVTVRRVRSVRLTAPGVTAYADGDAVGSLPLSVEVLPGALTVFATV